MRNHTVCTICGKSTESYSRPTCSASCNLALRSLRKASEALQTFRVAMVAAFDGHVACAHRREVALLGGGSHALLEEPNDARFEVIDPSKRCFCGQPTTIPGAKCQRHGIERPIEDTALEIGKH